MIHLVSKALTDLKKPTTPLRTPVFRRSERWRSATLWRRRHNDDVTAEDAACSLWLDIIPIIDQLGLDVKRRSLVKRSCKIALLSETLCTKLSLIHVQL